MIPYWTYCIARLLDAQITGLLEYLDQHSQWRTILAKTLGTCLRPDCAVWLNWDIECITSPIDRTWKGLPVQTYAYAWALIFSVCDACR
jgi:hypothetical protein